MARASKTWTVSLKIAVPHLWEFNTQYCRDKLIIIFYIYPAAWNDDRSRFRGRIKEKYFISLVNNKQTPAYSGDTFRGPEGVPWIEVPVIPF